MVLLLSNPGKTRAIRDIVRKEHHGGILWFEENGMCYKSPRLVR